MRSPKKSVSFGQRSFGTIASIKFVHRVQEAPRIFRITEQVRGFFERLEIFKRKHHHGTIVLFGDYHWFVIFTNRINGLCQGGSGFGVSDSVHRKYPERHVQEVVHYVSSA